MRLGRRPHLSAAPKGGEPALIDYLSFFILVHIFVYAVSVIEVMTHSGARSEPDIGQALSAGTIRIEVKSCAVV